MRIDNYLRTRFYVKNEPELSLQTPRSDGAFGSRGFLVLVFLLILAVSPLRSNAAGFVLYSTGFEANENYNTNLPLIGQNGWIGGGSGGNGITNQFFGGQVTRQAYIGGSAPAPGVSPVFAGPVINSHVSKAQFSVSMNIFNSSNTNWDNFYWILHNQEGNSLVILRFDNFSGKIYYSLDGGTNYVKSSLRWGNSVVLGLVMNLDFSGNNWDAAINGQAIATNIPITLTNYPLNLGKIDAAWSFGAIPGDNYMVFDDYKITSDAPVNDQCSGAIDMSENFTYTMDTSTATSTGDPSACGSLGKGVWYKYSPSASGKVTVNTCGSSFDTVLSVYTGSCGSLTPRTCSYFTYGPPCFDSSATVSFDGSPFTTYWILAGGYSGESGNLHIQVSQCVKPGTPSLSISQSTQPDGIHVSFCAFASGATSYRWNLDGGDPIFTSGGCLDEIFSPTDDTDHTMNVVGVNGCGDGPLGGTTTTTCGFCLTRSSPSLVTGSTGSGLGPQFVNSCGAMSANTRWYKMISSDAGFITLNTEGSSNVNQIAVYGGSSLAYITNITCVSKPQTRLIFNAVNDAVYWFAVDPGTNAVTTLRVATGFEPSIQNVKMTAGALELLSTVAPPVTYRVLASTNLFLPVSNWPVVFTTNWNSNFPYSDYRVDFMDTNMNNNPRRFYRLAPGP